MLSINMLSSADKVKGQGVGSAYQEQVTLVKTGLAKDYTVYVNKLKLADIMHYHTIDPKHFLMIPFSKRKGVNVGYVHFIPETVDDSLELPGFARRVFYWYMIKFYKKMDYLITVNPLIADKLEGYGIEKDKVTFIPNYVSLNYFYTMNEEKKKKLRDKYGIGQNDFVVMSAGQVQTRKGVMDFVRIAEELKDIKFIWAGGFSFGRITAGFKELKEVMENPPPNVKFLGILDRERMNEVYNISNLLFMPSYQETSSMTALEAFNCRVPVLLRNLDIYSTLFYDFYLKGSDNRGFIETIRRLKDEREYYDHWANQSWKGHEYYSEENILSLWKEFYDKAGKNIK